MKVTPSMMIASTETPMIELADFLGTDLATGVQVRHDRGEVVVEVDSLCWPSKTISLDPDTADALAELIKARAAEARS